MSSKCFLLLPSTGMRLCALGRFFGLRRSSHACSKSEHLREMEGETAIDSDSHQSLHTEILRVLVRLFYSCTEASPSQRPTVRRVFSILSEISGPAPAPVDSPFVEKDADYGAPCQRACWSLVLVVYFPIESMRFIWFRRHGSLQFVHIQFSKGNAHRRPPVCLQ